MFSRTSDFLLQNKVYSNDKYAIIITRLKGKVNIMNDSYLLYLLAAVIMIIAQSKVQNAYHKYKQIRNEKGLSGAATARKILDANGLSNIKVEVAQGGVLSDHYDPASHVVRLSPDIYYNKTIASVSVAAHEVGHAIQHRDRYGFIYLRNKLLPAANIASNLGWIILVLGLLFFYTTPIIFYTGVILLLIIVAFQLVTLPIELNASSRALKQLSEGGYIREDEKPACTAMLRAAAFTYLAALISSILQVLRAILISRKRED